MKLHDWRLFPALALVAGLAHAQVPRGWFVGAHISAPGAVLGTGGLFLHHPLGTVPSIPIQGLGPGLTGATASTTQFLGANSIAVVDAAASTFYVGEMVDDTAPALWAVDLHEVVVRGNGAGGYTATDTVLATLSTGPGPVPNSPNRQISGIAVVPGSTDAILVCAGFTVGAAATPLARFSRSQPGVVTPIPVSGLPTGMPNAVAISPDGATLWIGTFVDLFNGVLSAVPIQGGAAQQVAVLPAGVSSLALDPRTGHLWVGCLGGPPNLFEVDPASGAVTTVPTGIGTINTIAFEEATGHFVTGGGAAGLPPSSVGRVPLGGGVIVRTPPASGWGGMTGIAVVQDPWRFCPATPGPSSALDWVLPWTGAPGPLAGIPSAGNAAFGLSLRVAPGRAFAGLLGISFGLLDPGVPLLGGTVCVDLWNPAISTVLPFASPTSTWSLAVPLPASVAGTRVGFQAAVLDGPGFAFSRALGVEVH